MSIEQMNPMGGQYISLTGDWGKMRSQAATMTARSKKAMDRAVRDEAMLFARRAKKTITKGGGDAAWPKLATLTLTLRRNAEISPGHLGRSGRGRKPLVKTGDLRRSIGVEQKAWATYFAGVDRHSHRANAAAIHEKGPVTIEVTDKMRKFFMFLYIKGAIQHPVPFKKGSVIVIQQRSFLETTMRKFKRSYRDRMITRWHQYFWYNKRIMGT